MSIAFRIDGSGRPPSSPAARGLRGSELRVLPSALGMQAQRRVQTWGRTDGRWPRGRSDHAAQQVHFTGLPTLGKRYTLTVTEGEAEETVFEDALLSDMVAAMVEARLDLVETEPDEDTRQAALDSIDPGANNAVMV